MSLKIKGDVVSNQSRLRQSYVAHVRACLKSLTFVNLFIFPNVHSQICWWTGLAGQEQKVPAIPKQHHDSKEQLMVGACEFFR